ncbi:DUF2922 domain-containing protein [Selenomonas caprae]|uniref:DUF2922 domain-containing protein n=1 Tax=Selenomonas caprae TaxID=2606905 RepID=A0A5D6WQK6_9FIRM|nr:DUF2922 domain-containing protein [Selenomonas caprae]TYZ29389.1 DUF2922 domain-containing protein [Selenomonas caprae]
MVETTLMIIFWLDNGRTMTLSIPNPRSDLTQREVSMAMFELLKRRFILSENGGQATAVKHMYLRIVDEQLLP